MYDDIGVIHELRQKVAILDRVEVILHPVGTLEVPDVFDATCGKVIEQDYFIAAFEKTIRQMGADETGTAGN
jgi:hypothetical protein